MAHYRHHRQKEVDGEDSFDIDIKTCSVKTIPFQKKNTIQGIQSWYGFSMDLKNSWTKHAKALNE